MLFSDRKTHFLLENLIKIAFLHQNLFYIPKSEYNLNYISVFVFEIRSLFEAEVQFQFFNDCKNFITAAKRLLEAEVHTSVDSQYRIKSHKYAVLIGAE